MWKKLYPQVRRRLARIAQLEKSIDPKRTSSEPEEEESLPPTTGEPAP
jgi:hypothetical protein